jgi:hypothetical protein
VSDIISRAESVAEKAEPKLRRQPEDGKQTRKQRLEELAAVRNFTFYIARHTEFTFHHRVSHYCYLFRHEIVWEEAGLVTFWLVHVRFVARQIGFDLL